MLEWAINYADELKAKMQSTWFDENENLIEPGSYYFREEWSRIDNIFYSGKIEVEDFFPATEGFWCNENSIPYKYSLWNGRGYSDHLPLVVTLRGKTDKGIK